MDYDVKITGGTIIDGTGKPGYRGDVGVKGGKIVAVGEAKGSAKQTVDAEGKYVTPGFVDPHTHYDAQLVWDRMMTISPWHGVTSVVMGNCGFGVAPTKAAHREILMKTLEKVEGMSLESLRIGLGDNWPFESFPEYMDAIEKLGTALNVAVLVGHTPVRLNVMGEASMDRAATPEEIEKMARIVNEAMDAGAVGFSTSQSKVHVGFEGRPVPSRLAEWEELHQLIGAMAKGGRGTVQANPGPRFFQDQFAELYREFGRPITWTALIAGFWGPGKERDVLDKALELRRQGIDIWPQVSSRALTFEFNFKEPFSFENLKLFNPISAAHSVEEKIRIYSDPDFRKKFIAEFDEHTKRVLTQWWNKTRVAYYPPDPSLEEQTLGDVARQRGVHPVDLALDMSIETNLDTRFRLGVLNSDVEDVTHLLQAPGNLIALSDAGAHASQLCDACYSTDLLGPWVRERHVMSWEEAVRRLTSEPAGLFGITDRGKLEVGLAADIVTFDPQTVAPSRLRRVNDMPGKQERLVADATGIDLVMVNGTTIRKDNKDMVDAAGALPGAVLRGGKGAQTAA